MSLTSSAEFEITRDLVQKYGKISQSYQKDIQNKTGYEDISHTLPDGQVFTMKNQQIRIPEALFDPSMIGFDEKGIHEMINGTFIFDQKLFFFSFYPFSNQSASQKYIGCQHGLNFDSWKLIIQFNFRIAQTDHTYLEKDIKKSLSESYHFPLFLQKNNLRVF